MAGKKKLRAKRERFEIRVNASEKHLFKALQDTTGYTGSADIFRELITSTAKLALEYESGNISPEELERLAGRNIASLVVAGVDEMKKAGVTQAMKIEPE